jgi:Protein of unknown function (DUF4241)
MRTIVPRPLARRSVIALAVTLLGLASCGSPIPDAGVGTATASPDDLAAVELLTPDELASLFVSPPSSGFANPDGRYRLRVEPAGTLHLPTGAVVAADPGFDVRPFVARLPAGSAPVHLLRAAPPGEVGELVAAALLGDPAGLGGLRWENAYREGDDPAAFGPGDVVMYGVDSGTGSFASDEATRAMLADAGFTDRLLGAEAQAGWDDAVTVPVGEGLEIVAFPSGVGDGAYPTWVGYDADGNAAAFLTDFGILAHPASPPAPSVSSRVSSPATATRLR